MSYLILVRHGESEWNAIGLWTGLRDIPLSQKGKEEARRAGESIKDIKIDVAFTSVLTRAKETLDEIKKVLKLKKIETYQDPALNERDYGDFTGKNKWEIKKKLGDQEFLRIRRGWDFPIPNGESLKDVYNRVVPYYKGNILPKLLEGKNILVSAHGNSIRALVKYLEKISDQDIPNVDLATGEVLIYKIGDNGEILSKEIRK